MTRISRAHAIGFRVRAQRLDADPARPRPWADTAVLDIGVQDTGPDGAGWAMAIRGAAPPAADESLLLWTIRGAPHVYRRRDLARIIATTAPFSDADAGKRIYDAAKPLKAAGMSNLDALDTVARAMRSVVTGPMVKGEVSTQVTRLLPPPLLRFCRPCQATHPYEQTFRLAALRAGLELRAGTSPPVLEPIPDLPPDEIGPDAAEAIRTCLRLLGPTTPKDVADFFDAPVRDVRAAWPADSVEVDVEGRSRWVLAADRAGLDAGPATTVRLLPPYDLLLQARDRSLLVPDPARAKELWPVLGRPGAVLAGSDLVGTWRARRKGDTHRVEVRLWHQVPAAVRRGIADQAERLASHRGGRLAALDVSD